MMLGKIVGADEGLKSPVQNVDIHGAVDGYFIITPRGVYSNLPNDTIVNVVGKNSVIPATLEVPELAGLAVGDVAFYHPEKLTSIIFKNNGDIDVKGTNINIDATTTNIGVGGNAIARVGDSVEVSVVGGSSAGTHNGTITSGGDNTSI